MIYDILIFETSKILDFFLYLYYDIMIYDQLIIILISNLIK